MCIRDSTPDRAVLSPEQRKAAEFVQSRAQHAFVVLSKGSKPSWEEWEAEVLARG